MEHQVVRDLEGLCRLLNNDIDSYWHKHETQKETLEHGCYQKHQQQGAE
jgi:hypothetical protein